jgi:hypothetical protein
MPYGARPMEAGCLNNSHFAEGFGNRGYAADKNA